jgi:ubiquitin-conjugating enzyme E2 Q
MYKWLAHLDVFKFDIEKNLREQFTRLRDEFNQPAELVFEVMFNSNFPFDPPFIRVVRPRFGFQTGHVTIGGSICMQSLTPSGWIPVRTVESVFIEILFNM